MTINQAENISRDQIDEKFHWKLTDLYASDEEWKRKKTQLSGAIKNISTFKGKLDQSAESLFQALNFYSEVEKEFLRLYAYASMQSDQDTRDSKAMAMKQEMTHLQTDLKSAAAFFEPEIFNFHCSFSPGESLSRNVSKAMESSLFVQGTVMVAE